MTLTVTARRVSSAPDLLGESPIWDDHLGRLYWVDGVSRLIRYLDHGKDELRQIEMPSMVGSIGLCRDRDRLIAALADGIYSVRLADGGLDPIHVPEPKNERIRFNDGKVDRQGRFVCGTMSISAEPEGTLIRVSTGGEAECLVTGIRISNATCFSPDGGTLYFADSLDREIRAYEYSPRREPLSEPRIHVDTRRFASGPDGATVDSEGCLWVALVQAGKIGRFAPDGSLDQLIETPVDLPSCVTFGGPDMATLYVTSIRDSGSGRAISRHPDGGYLFAMDGLGATGIPEPLYG